MGDGSRGHKKSHKRKDKGTGREGKKRRHGDKHGKRKRRDGESDVRGREKRKKRRESSPTASSPSVDTRGDQSAFAGREGCPDGGGQGTARPDWRKGDNSAEGGAPGSVDESGGGLAARFVPAIGPQLPPGVSIGQLADAAAVQEPEDPRDGRRGIGPCLPPDHNSNVGRGSENSIDEGSVDSAPLVGPMPPEVQEEAGAAPAGARDAEVLRVMAVVASAGPGSHPDAYDVLGVDPGASTSAVRKRYWMLSLLVHPDKCGHPKAQQAFQAVNHASKQLLDEKLRAAVDGGREDAKLRKMAEEAARQLQREQDWASVRAGRPLSSMPQATDGPPAREAWMTELPPERRPSKQPSQVSQTAFSRQGAFVRGDSSAWTSTPGMEERNQQLERLGCQGPHSSAVTKVASKGAPAHGVDKPGKKSLLEKHLEKLEKEKKSKKKSKGPGNDGAFANYRPFDRERDLQHPGTQTKSIGDMVKNAKSLHSRFTGGS
ncbi:unnamed protein product [Ostreobium quekettii]|uniref:J domain-containing protein n=1 Tax=Ostreobium quekettii TaxID=121088 RepID=A0A8S1J0T7_9CHLO|nr:unnamed protein product [Ostreobium quekettii]